MNVEAKGRYQVQKRITQHKQLRVIFGLIKAIYVGAPDKSSGKRRQSVRIEYDLIGFIPLDELMKQETA